MSKLNDMILGADAQIDAIATYLDGLDDNARVEEATSIGGKAQARLWDLADGRSVSREDIVPTDRAALETVRHHGRNSLPVFTRFEKRFCRPPEDAQHAGDHLWGFNFGPTMGLVGPGYFVARATPGDDRGEFVVDYYQVPPEKPAIEDWPALKSNEQGLQVLVYSKMHDFLRKVSDHVTIGRAFKKDKITNNFFVLCRER